jgi:ATP-dependent DNA helicase RecQ
MSATLQKPPARHAAVKPEPAATLDAVRQAIRRHWGFESFRPLQEEAIKSVLAGRDSVVVLPTGGGKSLCFQAPACCLDGVAVVVSPLIALMKDQVDALRTAGVAAAFYNSTLSPGDKRRVVADLRAGKLTLLYLAPESLLTDEMLQLLESVRVSLLAIDEAHCISTWGHDFRVEYRGLRVLKQRFPHVAVHAYTATATERVRQDIAEQLALDDPEMFIGSFDRPNLVYRVEQRVGVMGQIVEVLKRHPNESGIVYCITRKEVEQTAAALETLGYRAAAYHAGMEAGDRMRNQEAFLAERVDVIVATIAFGMGIDKSNVRYVIHTGMPKSVEAYQQESGRAGRDGLEAECCLFYTNGDVMKWKRLIRPAETGYEEAMAALAGIDRFCNTLRCRHQLLVEHFGQTLDRQNCQACDVCTGQLQEIDEPLVVAQKILSCVVRLKQQFGGDYTAAVLTGSKEKRILEKGHDKLSTYGILSDQPQRAVRDWIEQLVGQGCARKQGEYNQLEVTELGWQVLGGKHTPRLLQPAPQASQQSRGVDPAAWEGVDRGLFEALRELRAQLAAERKVPAYIVFGDATLRDLACRRPSTPQGFLSAQGVGEKKWADFGRRFLECIADYCTEQGVAQDVPASAVAVSEPRTILSASGIVAFPMFAQGESLEAVAQKMKRAMSTVCGYLEQYIRQEGVTDPSPWVDAKTVARVREAIDAVGMERLKPLFEHLSGEVPYEQIRIVANCLANAETFS